MSETSLSRFTPSLLSHESLEALLVQRHALAQSIVEGIRESALTGNKHYYLLIGPRGIGKTHLVSLLFHRIDRDEELKDRLLIAWLREEEWGVASYFHLLRVILRSLVERYKGPLKADYEQMLKMEDAATAEGVAEKMLTAFVGKKSLLLLAENFDEIFAGLEKEGQHKLRAFIQNNPIFTIVAAAQSLFNGVMLRDEPFYGFFETHHLNELSYAEAVDLVANIAEREGNPGLATVLRSPQGRARMRAVHHLAGGNPRVYVIFSQFVTVDSIDHLVKPLLATLDDLTPYYQSRMAFLSPQQRQIVEHLCEARGAKSVKDITKACFISSPQTTSSQMQKLDQLGYVRSTQRGRESYYELREPLLRMTLDVKKARGEPVEIIVEFLRIWYSTEELSLRLASVDGKSLVDRHYLEAALKAGTLEQSVDIAAICEAAMKQFIEAKDLDRALEVSEELVAIRGNFLDLWRHARMHIKAGDNAAAIADMSAIIDMPDTPAAMKVAVFAVRGATKGLLQDTAGAVADCTLAIDLGFDTLREPTEFKTFVFLTRGNFREELQDRIGAVTDYTLVINMPDAPVELKARAIVRRGIMKEEMQDTAGAIADYTLAIDMPDAPVELKAKAIVRRGIMKEEIQDTAGAIADYTLAIDMPDAPAEQKAQSLLLRGVMKEAMQNTAGTIADYTLVIDMSDATAAQKATALVLRGALREEMQDTAGTIADYTLVIDMSDATAEQKATALVLRGAMREEMQDTAGAIADFKLILSMPDLSADIKNQARRYLGTVLHESGRPEEAIEYFRAAIDANPVHSEVNSKLGEALACAGMLLQALDAFDRECSLQGTEATFNVRSNRAAILLALGQTDEGRIALDEAVRQLSSDDGEDGEYKVAIIRNLLLRSKDPAEWRRMIPEFVKPFAEHGVMVSLGQGLVASIPTLRNADVSLEVANNWLVVWRELAGSYKEMALPLRLLDAAVRYLPEKDDRPLLALPIEERKIIEPLLGIMPEQTGGG